MKRNWGVTVIRIALLCLGVGLVISALGLTPESLLGLLGNTVIRLFNIAVDLVQWAVPYVLVGTVVVIPIWLLLAIVRYARGRCLSGGLRPGLSVLLACSVRAAICGATHRERTALSEASRRPDARKAAPAAESPHAPCGF